MVTHSWSLDMVHYWGRGVARTDCFSWIPWVPRRTLHCKQNAVKHLICHWFTGFVADQCFASTLNFTGLDRSDIAISPNTQTSAHKCTALLHIIKPSESLGDNTWKTCVSTPVPVWLLSLWVTGVCSVCGCVSHKIFTWWEGNNRLSVITRETCEGMQSGHKKLGWCMKSLLKNATEWNLPVLWCDPVHVSPRPSALSHTCTVWVSRWGESPCSGNKNATRQNQVKVCWRQTAYTYAVRNLRVQTEQ